jgi:hypothetical protein
MLECSVVAKEQMSVFLTNKANVKNNEIHREVKVYSRPPCGD